MDESAREIDLNTAAGSSRICIGRLARPRDSAPSTRVLIVFDQAVTGSFPPRVLDWAQRWGHAPTVLRVAAGEPLKSLSGWVFLLDAFADARLDRGSVVVAVGGGSIGDAVGFAAATWHRGVAWIGVPTTVVGMVDALVGGKTAINFRGKKNVVGAFHLPREVHIDPEALRGLPALEIRAGWAEILKTAIIGCPGLFQDFVRGTCRPSGEPPPVEILAECVSVKADIVNRDLDETGDRRLLNLGHTLGHALEGTLDAGTIRHGEAVAIGLAFASRIAVDLGLARARLSVEIDAVLDAWTLPRRWNPELTERLFGAMLHDKKNRGGALWLALPREIGDVAMVEVPADVIKRRLRKGADSCP